MNGNLLSRMMKKNDSSFSQIWKTASLYTNNPELIKPKNVVWHVTSPKNRLSIDALGLVIIPGSFNKNAIYANNMERPVMGIYQCLYDDYSEDFFNYKYVIDDDTRELKIEVTPTYDEYFGFLGLDFWMIDTTALDNIWYLDYNYEYDYNAVSGKNYYIYTHDAIPREALRLFRFSRNESFYCKKGVIDGVYSAKFTPRMREITKF